MDKSMIREALENSGVFKNADALVRFCEADEYWERLPYGKRLYFGEGPADYLHRDVLRAALNALAELDKPGEGEVSGTGMVEAGNAMKEAIGQIAYELEEGMPLTDDSLCITEAERTVSKWDAALKSTNTPERRPGECDYRKRECVNDGKTVNGVWVCNNHLSNTPQAVTVEGIMELVDDCIDMRDGDGSCVVWPVLDEDQLRTRLDQYLNSR